MKRLFYRGNYPEYGMLSEYATPEALIEAIERLKAESPVPNIEAFTPYPVHSLDAALARKKSRLPLFMLLGGLLGGIGGYLMQYYAMVLDYPVNIGGRPLHSWPAFVPPTFEMTILGAALTGFLGLLLACALPRFHHPVFDEPRFRRASQDHMFILVATRPDGTDRAAILKALHETRPLSISAIPKP